MSNLSYLIKKGNDFSKSQIDDLSLNLHNLFTINLEKESTKLSQQIEQKNELLILFLELLRKALFSDLVIDKKEKIALINTMDKLKIQHELLELIMSENVDDKMIELLESSKRFGKKAQSSVDEKELDDLKSDTWNAFDVK